MKVILFGATGMIGQGVLRECLLDPGVEQVLSIGRRAVSTPALSPFESIGRRPCGTSDAKLREIVHTELTDLSAIESELAGYDACFFCLGTSSAGMSEAEYRRVTYDVALAAAKAIAKRSPGSTFVFVSGVGTDSTEKSRTMWARVKGATENALLAMPFKAAYMFRPAYIQPLHGIKASGRGTRAMYAALAPLYPVWKALFPRQVTTTELVGRAMIRVAREGASKHLLENADISALGTA
jgi:uncharacterized protein YbjT (DUF2867 family)